MNEVKKAILKNDAEILMSQLGTFAKKHGYEYISMWFINGDMSINNDVDSDEYFDLYKPKDHESCFISCPED